MKSAYLLLVCSIAVVAGINIQQQQYKQSTQISITQSQSLSISTPTPTLAPCSCSNVSMCQPLRIPPRKEFVGFTVYPNNFGAYDLSHLTTIMVFASSIDPQLVCQAHAAGVRVIAAAKFPPDQLTNLTYHIEWITSMVSVVQTNHYDGINIDFEDNIPKNETMVTALLTALVTDVTWALKSINPFYQISMDMPPAPFCDWGRCYDFFALSEALDFIIAMDYDMNSNGIAAANSDFPTAMSGAAQFLGIGIPPEKVVQAFPWYGYDYICNGNMTLTTRECTYDTSQRWNNSVVASNCYEGIMETFNQSTNDGMHWDDLSESPFFNYVSGDNIRQVWFDDPKSIYIKVQAAKDLGIGGVGIWYIDCCDPGPMWQAVNSFFE
ncbi:hypothetical protein SAMD00019534_100650, partial [Acytostelium subglobosum LB1]|uniref:hypothetical protein n=1 Tax=Acytostelium subglobosum LB1 TaxID=1410327 RepID=UPI000644AD01